MVVNMDMVVNVTWLLTWTCVATDKIIPNQFQVICPKKSEWGYEEHGWSRIARLLTWLLNMVVVVERHGAGLAGVVDERG